jgi:hypothetical protein
MPETEVPVELEPIAPVREEVEVIVEPAPGPALSRQPLAGAAGLVVVAALVSLLAVAPGGPQTALQVTVPMLTFGLTPLAVMALWWGRWPADRLSRPAGLLVNTVLLVAAGFLMTVGAQAVVGKVDIDGIFSQATDQAAGHLTAFPFTFPLAGIAFATMVHLTLVLERKPFDRLGRVASGAAALATSCAVALVAYRLVANWDAVPEAGRSLLSLRNPNGPVAALDIIGWLTCVVVAQTTFYLLLGGWPFTTIKRIGARLFAGTVTTVGGGWLAYLGAHDLLHWSIPTIGAVGGSMVAAITLVALLFGGWPYASEEPAGARLGLLATAVTVAAVLYWGLKWLGNLGQDWTQYPVELWVATTALITTAPMVILYVAIWNRWPLPDPSESNPEG